MTVTRRFIMQKARRHMIYMLRPLVGAWVQDLFHSPFGVLFTVPSRYYTLSVSWEYLALPDGPGRFTQDYSCPALLRIQDNLRTGTDKGLSPAAAGLSSPFSLCAKTITPVLQPRRCRYIAGLGSSPVARHYWGNHCYFLFLRVLRCFSSPG